MVDSTTILLVVITFLTGVFIWSRRTYVYWRRRRIKFVKPTHLLGNLKEVLKFENSFALQLRNFYFDERFQNERIVGIYLFHQPALLIRDLALVRTVLVEDFVSFSQRFARCDPHEDKLGSLNLVFVKNPEWQQIRTRLSPVFSTGRLRQMFALMEQVSCDLDVYLQKLTDSWTHKRCLSADAVDIKEICNLYSADMIASIAFGFRTYNLRNTEPKQSAHSHHHIRQPSILRTLEFCLIFFLPNWVRWLRPKLFTADHSDFLRRTIRQVIEERERTGELRNDLIEMLLTLKKEADLNQDRSHFTHDQDYLIAQAAGFEIGAFETCAGAMSFALYELAKQPVVQTRLRSEIHEMLERHADSVTFDAVTNMEYLDMVVDETLRKYPIVPFLERECTPVNKKRFYSFRPQVECRARRGMPVFISNLAIHYDSQHWPNPDRFDPERFSPECKKTQTPLSYLPFGAGPRSCIGAVIARFQIKLGLLHFLRDHRVAISEKSNSSIKFDPKYALLANEGGIYLQVTRCC